MSDEKVSAAFHPFSSLEEARAAGHSLKPRDEIAQRNVDDREKHIDLESLPKKPLSELAEGDVVLHEGIWVKINEYEVLSGNPGCIRLRLVLPNASAPVWERRVISMGHEEFYVAGGGKGMSAGRHAQREIHPSLVRRVPTRDEQI